MEQLKNNQFAVAIAAIIFVYVILYMFVVSPIYTDGQRGIEILKRKLGKDKRHLDEYANPRAIIPSEELIKYHTQKKEELIAAKKKIYDIFISKSQSLKKSFKEVKEKEEQDGNVSLSYFQLVYEKEVSNIVKKYANESGGLKIGESKEDDFFDGVSSKEKQVREILRFDDSRSIVSTTTQAEAQKKFWIIQNILGIMEESKVKSLKQLLVRKNDSPSYPGFEEYNIEMTIDVDFKNMPSIIQRILQSEDMLTEISFVNMSRNESYTPEDITVFVKIGQTEQQAQDEELKKKGISSIPVSVRIGCKVLNYIQPEK